MQLKEALIVKHSELFLLGSHITPLPTASTHIHPDPTHTRKLLLHIEQIRKLIGKVSAPATHWCRSICISQGAHQAGDGLAKGAKTAR